MFKLHCSHIFPNVPTFHSTATMFLCFITRVDGVNDFAIRSTSGDCWWMWHLQITFLPQQPQDTARSYEKLREDIRIFQTWWHAHECWFEKYMIIFIANIFWYLSLMWKLNPWIPTKAVQMNCKLCCLHCIFCFHI